MPETAPTGESDWVGTDKDEFFPLKSREIAARVHPCIYDLCSLWVSRSSASHPAGWQRGGEGAAAVVVRVTQG